MTEKKSSSGYSAPILYKAFAIIEEISNAQSQLGISDIARRLNISKSTVHGIIQTLINLEVIRQDAFTKKLRLGPTLVHLGNKALAGVDLRMTVRPFMEKLCAEFRETIFLGTFNEQRITIIEKVDSPADLKITAPVGTSIPLFAGATGKVFLAGLEDPVLNNILAVRSIPQYTPKSVTEQAEYLKEIEKVRKLGYATDFEEYIQGVNAVCVPISDMPGRNVAALWMVGFTQTFTSEKMSLAITALKRVVDNINESLRN